MKSNKHHELLVGDNNLSQFHVAIIIIIQVKYVNNKHYMINSLREI